MGGHVSVCPAVKLSKWLSKCIDTHIRCTFYKHSFDAYFQRKLALYCSMWCGVWCLFRGFDLQMHRAHMHSTKQRLRTQIQYIFPFAFQITGNDCSIYILLTVSISYVLFFLSFWTVFRLYLGRICVYMKWTSGLASVIIMSNHVLYFKMNCSLKIMIPWAQ